MHLLLTSPHWGPNPFPSSASLALSQQRHISCDTPSTLDEHVQISLSPFAALLMQGEEGKAAPRLSDLRSPIRSSVAKLFPGHLAKKERRGLWKYFQSPRTFYPYFIYYLSLAILGDILIKTHSFAGSTWRNKPMFSCVRRSMRRAEVFLQALEPVKGDAYQKRTHG